MLATGLHVPVCAQLPAYLKFPHYTTGIGLPNGQITELNQDRAGFLWVAARSGISRFDGRLFRSYRLPASPRTRLADDTRPVFATDERGMLWLLTQRGLYRYDARLDSLLAVDTPLSHWLVRPDIHLLLDKKRHCFWMTTSRGLFRYDLHTGCTYPTSINQLFRPFRALLTVDDQLVIAASEGVYVYDPARNSHWFDTIDEDGNEHFISAFMDTDGHIWMGRNGRGLVLFDPKTRQVTHFKPPTTLVQSKFISIQDIATVPAVTGDSLLWLATHDFGLLFFNRRNRRFVGNYVAQPALIQGLLTNQIDRLFTDREGRLWLANQALVQFDPADQAMHTERLNIPPMNLQNSIPNREYPGRPSFPAICIRFTYTSGAMWTGICGKFGRSSSIPITRSSRF